jgi:endoribonuclease Dicer
MKQVAGKDWNKPLEETDKHHLGDKSVADVCEALIGAALLSPNKPGEVVNMDMAVQAVSTFVSNEHHNVTKWADYYPLYKKPKYQLAQATASQLDLAMQVETIHDYHFKYPRLLRSAFIHPSYTFAAEKIPCYQRLEFLGDSLLDMASINFLFHRHPDKDPQWLTEHKVSSPFIAASAENPLTFADGDGLKQVPRSLVSKAWFS